MGPLDYIAKKCLKIIHEIIIYFEILICIEKCAFSKGIGSEHT